MTRLSGPQFFDRIALWIGAVVFRRHKGGIFFKSNHPQETALSLMAAFTIAFKNPGAGEYPNARSMGLIQQAFHHRQNKGFREKKGIHPFTIWMVAFPYSLVGRAAGKILSLVLSYKCFKIF